MNATERAQVAALRQYVNFGPHSDGQQFVKHLGWLLDREPKAVLTPRQKYFLVALCWRYRRQLAGRVHDTLIPREPPLIGDYVREDPVRQLGMPV